MPKAATYTLAWSAERQAYTLYNHHTELDLVLGLDTPTWREWLEQVASFAFRGQKGTYTARKEQIKQSDWYWYAYQRAQKRVRKKYVGKSAALTVQRLEEVAQLFNAEQATEGEPASDPVLVQTRRAAHEHTLVPTLRAPLAPRHLVMRPRLLERLQGTLTRIVTLICAPAGFGKSTLLSNWLEQSIVPSAWLSLGDDHNDRVRFWSYLFAAIDMLRPGAGEYALGLLHALYTPQIEGVLTLLIKYLEAEDSSKGSLPGSADHRTLVLDDYHLISEQAIHNGIAFLLERLPSYLHLILITRSYPPLPLTRLRLQDQVLEFYAADLRFTSEEIGTFFFQHGAGDLSSTEMVLLEERTEGWVAGLQLAALLLQGQPEQTDRLQSLSGSHRSIVDYFGQEVFANLPEHVQQFLLRTSILERLEGGLCEAVSGQLGGQERLAWLEQANLFLIPLDAERHWYRYHQLFADMLRQRLRQSAAESIPELHQRASRWYRVQGMLDEAVAHAHTAGDLAGIVSIAEEFGVELMSRGEIKTVMNWVALLPRSLLFSRLRLFLYECWWRWYAGHAAVVAEMLREYSHQHGLPGLEVEDVATLEQAICAHVDAQYPHPHWSYEQRANRIAEMLALYGVLTMQRADGAAFSQAVCRRAVVLVAGMAYRARIGQHLGTVSILRGDLTAAVAALEEALASAIADGSATWVTSAGYRLVMLYEMLGQLPDVTRISQEILQLATGKTILTKDAAYLFLGNVEYERNNLETAEAYFKQVVASYKNADLLKLVDPFMHFLLAQLRLARIHSIRGNNANAHQCLTEVANYLSLKWIGPEVFPVVKGEYVLLMHTLGDETAARQWLEESVPPEGDPLLVRQFISLNHNRYLIFMKLLLVARRWQEAEQLLQDQQARAERQERTGNLIQWLILRTLLHQAQDETGQALSAIARALSLAESRGYLRSFLDEGAFLLTLLYRLRDDLRNQHTTAEPIPTLGYLNRLILLLKHEQRPDVKPGEHTEQSLVEPLSERELEVLQHISAGRSNREIAGQLVIALSTVKSHVGTIYAKLGVQSRTQALVHARKLKLL